MKCVKILILMVMMSGIYTVGAAQETGAAQELNVLPKPCSVRITDTDGRYLILAPPQQYKYHSSSPSKLKFSHTS